MKLRLYSGIMFILCCFLLSCSSEENTEVEEDNSVETPEESIESQFQPCEDGFAGPYPCSGFDLMGHVDLETLEGSGFTNANDIWGWTDPSNGNEYAIIGTRMSTAFVDISDPERPVLLGRLPASSVPHSHRDIKVYQNFAFIVSEAEEHGMQVFDLTKLRDVSDPPASFESDAVYQDFGAAHNLAINEDSGYAYALGSDTYNGGPHFVNIQDPRNPQVAGGFVTDSASHDAQVITYDGPDTDYLGKEIFVGSNEAEIIILDVSDKSNPEYISTLEYENLEYVHQGWFTEDRKYFIVGDEFDELANGFNTRTLFFDFQDLDNPELHTEYFGLTPAIDHNGYPHNGNFYLANYTAGLRVLDISQLDGKQVEETGFFDTEPSTDESDFDGAWGVYPFFPSGNIIISDIYNGLFIVRRSGT